MQLMEEGWAGDEDREGLVAIVGDGLHRVVGLVGSVLQRGVARNVTVVLD